MEAANFLEPRHCSFGTIEFDIRPLPVSPQEDLRLTNIPPSSLAFQFQQTRITDHKIINLPTLALEFQFHNHEEWWYITPHHRPLQLLYIAEYQTIQTKSVHLKLSPSEYTSYDVLYRALQGNLTNWDHNCKIPVQTIIHRLIGKIHKCVDDELNKGTTRPNLDMFAGLTLKVDYVWDGRLEEEEELGLFNYGRMVPASKSSIMQLPERMEIDEDQCLSDDCAICFEQLGKDQGKNILCMPCSHMFHRDCITRWLYKAHSCPICRCDLPTAE